MKPTLLAALLFLATSLAAQTVVFTTSPDDSTEKGVPNIIAGGSGSSIREAFQFTAAPVDYALHSVSAKLSTNFPADATLQFHVAIYSDGGGNPDSLLQTLTNPASIADWPTPGATDTIFTAAATLTLLANTDYWLVFTPTGLGSSDNLLRLAVDDENSPTTGLNSFSTSPAGPVVWDNWSSPNLISLPVFTVYGTAIPEPSTLALLTGFAALGVAAWRRRRAA